MATCIGRARGCDRGWLGGNVEVLEEMRELRECLESMEMDRRRERLEERVKLLGRDLKREWNNLGEAWRESEITTFITLASISLIYATKNYHKGRDNFRDEF